MAIITSRPPYKHRPINDKFTLQALIAWIQTELGNVSRAIPPSRARIVTTDDYPNNQDDLVVCDATTAAFTEHLPPPSQASGLRLTFKKVDASTHAVTIGATVDGVANPTLVNQYSTKTVQSDGVRWNLLSQIL